MKKGGKLECWKFEKLTDVFELRPPKKEARDLLSENDFVSFLPMEDLDVFQRDVVAVKEKTLKEVSASYTYFANNDVLLAKITPCFENGKAGIVRNLKNGIGFGSSEYIVFRSKGNVIPEFLFYFFALDEFRKEGKKAMAGAAGQKRVSPKFIESLDFAYPPLPEQQRIVSVLDEAFASIAQAKSNAERNLVNARELFEAAQRELFEGIGNKKSEVKMLGEVATFRNGINFTKASKGETVKIVGVKDFQNYFWVPLDNLDSVTIDGKLSETDYLRKGDILAVRSNGNQQLIGRTILASDVTEKTTHSGFTIRIRFESKDIFPEYLCHYLKSEKARKQLISGGAGINIKSLNQTTLSELPISLPPLAEQRAIVGRLEALSAETGRLEEIYQQKVESLEELKKSVLGKAFAGEL